MALVVWVVSERGEPHLLIGHFNKDQNCGFDLRNGSGNIVPHSYTDLAEGAAALLPFSKIGQSFPGLRQLNKEM